MISHLKNAQKVFFLLLLSVAILLVGCNTITSATEIANFGVNQVKVVPNHELTYTIWFRNTSNNNLQDLLLDVKIDDINTELVENSSTYLRKGKRAISLNDTWINDGINISKLNRDDEVTITFRVRVKSTAQIGTQIKAFVQVYSLWPYNGTLIPHTVAYQVNTEVVSPNERALFENNGNNFYWEPNGDGYRLIFESQNIGDYEARNTTLKIIAPINYHEPMSKFNFRAELKADNASVLIDTLEISLPYGSGYLSLHDNATRFTGNTTLYSGGQQIPNYFLGENGMPFGSLEPGKSIQVIFYLQPHYPNSN
jgi:hypothetical protein